MLWTWATMMAVMVKVATSKGQITGKPCDDGQI